jgi:hypothetical protein
VHPHHRITQLLRTLNDARNGWDTRSNGGGPKLMPRMYHQGSYAELESAMHQLRDTNRRLWWHTANRYLWTTPRIATITVHRTRQGPMPHPPPHTEVDLVLRMGNRTATARLNTWAPTTNPELTQQGIAALAELMYRGDTSRITLPPDLLAPGLQRSPSSSTVRNANGRAAL